MDKCNFYKELLGKFKRIAEENGLLNEKSITADFVHAVNNTLAN
ncbi:MAG: hypothetical protein AAGU01_00605 [Clostridiaceae bacterium]